MSTEPESAVQGFFLVDVSMALHRNFHSLQELKSSTGIPTGMEFGTLRMMETLKRRHAAHEFVMCYDLPGNWRRKKDERYKANRRSKTGAELSDFMRRANDLKPILNALYAHCEVPGLEADDIMFQLSRRPGHHIVYTNDKDLLQAAKDDCAGLHHSVTILKSHDNSTYPWTAQKVLEEFGVEPHMLPMYRALVGDASDNLDGLKRVDKEILADCVRHAAGYENLYPVDALKAALCYYRDKLDRWTDSEWERIRAFMDHGTLLANYELMALDQKASSEVLVSFPTREYEPVKAFLKRLEIRTLGICKELFKDEIVNEEF